MTERRPKKDANGKFVPGGSGPGRKRGSRNRLSETFVAALLDDFEAHGRKAIAVCRADDPSTYLRVIAALVPKKIEVERSPVEELSDDELASLIDHVRSAVAADAPAGGAGPESPGKPASRVRPVH